MKTFVNPKCSILDLKWSKKISSHLASDSLKHSTPLLILRLFIGLGWMRACVEKWNSSWISGDTIIQFLNSHLNDGSVAFPFYQLLIENVFLSHAHVLAVLILFAQGMIGFMIFFGSFTNLALLIGIFLNLNFILAGAPNPSAFYVMIQMVLFSLNTGAVLGCDAYLKDVFKSRLLVAQPADSSGSALSSHHFAGLSMTMIAVSGLSLFFVKDFTPHGSVHDSAMVIAVLAGFLAIKFLLNALASQSDRRSFLNPSAPMPPQSVS